jgi:hypothetical protein
MPSPVAWAPSFAGELKVRPHFLPPRRRPGPNWGTSLTTDALRYFDLTNWAPAFAGVVGGGEVGASGPQSLKQPRGTAYTYAPTHTGTAHYG